MILNLGGHIGSSVSALVDGQLSAEDEERAWGHVLTCPGCRRLVAREGWTKSRLTTLATPGAVPAPTRLLGALYDVDAWAVVDELERRSNRRRATVALVGAGSVGAAVLGLMALTAPPAGLGEVPGGPAPAVIRSEVAGTGQGASVGIGVGTRSGADGVTTDADTVRLRRTTN